MVAREPELFPVDCLDEAARILSSAEPSHPIDIVVGNKIAPVPLEARFTFFERTLPLHNLDTAVVEKLYWNHLEYYRLRTSNGLPNINYLCLAALIRRGVVSSVITTNYDIYLQSVERRDPSFRFHLNPCLRPEDTGWDSDGYYSRWPWGWPPTTIRDGDGRLHVPLWKVHGDLGFVRWAHCDHRFGLPDFAVGRPPLTDDERRRFWEGGVHCLHGLALTKDGEHYHDDATMRRMLGTAQPSRHLRNL